MNDAFSLNPLPSAAFGAGSLKQLSSVVEGIGSRFLIITGNGFRSRHTPWPEIEKQLSKSAIWFEYATVGGEPSPEIVDQLVAAYFPQDLDGVVAMGGGSVLDAGKAVAAMLPSGKPIEQFLEGVGSQQPDGRTLPFVAVPTTAGTGSEATANAVITRTGAKGYKKSLRHRNYVPAFALIDPLLMRSCPPALTAACAMDAFTQLVEGFLSTGSSPLTDAVAWSGIEAVQRSLVRVFIDGNDLQARADMAYASFCSGIVLANAGLGIIHGLAPAVGSGLAMPHGAVCGTLMAAGNQATLAKLGEMVDSDPSLQGYIDKYQRLGRLFCAQKGAAGLEADCFIEKLHELVELLELPRLSAFGARPEDVRALAGSAPLKNNPVPLSREEIETLVLSRL